MREVLIVTHKSFPAHPPRNMQIRSTVGNEKLQNAKAKAKSSFGKHEEADETYLTASHSPQSVSF